MLCTKVHSKFALLLSPASSSAASASVVRSASKASASSPSSSTTLGSPGVRIRGRVVPMSVAAVVAAVAAESDSLTWAAAVVSSVAEG